METKTFQQIPQTEPKVIDTTQGEARARAEQLARLAGDEAHPERFIQIATKQVIDQKYGKKNKLN